MKELHVHSVSVYRFEIFEIFSNIMPFITVKILTPLALGQEAKFSVN